MNDKKQEKKDMVKLSMGHTTETITIAYFPFPVIREVESVSSRIHAWYIDPLKKMDGRQSFVVLMVLLPLYETHLKVTGKIKDGEHFTKGHPVFKTIGHDLGIKADEAYEFWQCFRNGLIHTSIPKEIESFRYDLRATGQPVEHQSGVFYINAFALRDHLLVKIEANLKDWKSYHVRLPESYVES